MLLKNDCRHFPGIRPCKYNKQNGQICPDCAHYQTKGKRILITKLDALGDVLRTTALLPGLKERYPDSYIVWITRSIAADLFRHNPFIDELWLVEVDAIPRLQVESFDLVINPDADKWTASLATLAQAKDRLGLGLDQQGNVVPLTVEAEEWLQMGAFDHLKRANQKTYQQIIYEMSQLPYRPHRPIFNLTDLERKWGSDFLSRQGYDPTRKLVAVNLGGGGRWRQKRWTDEHILTFSKMIIEDPHLQLLIIAGPFETALVNKIQSELDDQALFSGTDRSLRELGAIVSFCDTIVTGDTLVLHIATALNRRAVALFGPTSAAEIELYGNGTKLHPSMDCYCCYLADCNKNPKCMDLITPEIVKQAI